MKKRFTDIDNQITCEFEMEINNIANTSKQLYENYIKIRDKLQPTNKQLKIDDFL